MLFIMCCLKISTLGEYIMNKSKKFSVFLSGSCLLFAIFSCLFGFSLNSISFSSKVKAAAAFENNQQFTHISAVGAKEKATYDDFMSTCKALYGQKKKINSYISSVESFNCNIENILFEPTICTVSAYSDKKEMECITLPLYYDDFSIGKGPVGDAQFASYIPSSIADKLINNGDFSSFDEIINEHIEFYIFVNDKEYSFSVNNIYLNNNSSNWNTNDINFDYINHFASWNKDSIFAYCPLVLRNIDVCFSADARPGYGNLNFLCNSIASSIDKSVAVTLFNNNIDSFFKIDEVATETVSKHFGVLQILFALLMTFTLFISILLLYLIIKYYYYEKINLILFAFCITALIIGEFLKSIIGTNAFLYSVFNRYTNISMLIIAIFMTLTFFMVSKRKTNDSEAENHIITI